MGYGYYYRGSECGFWQVGRFGYWLEVWTIEFTFRLILKNDRGSWIQKEKLAGRGGGEAGDPKAPGGFWVWIWVLFGFGFLGWGLGVGVW